jgi:hypothetical protein
MRKQIRPRGLYYLPLGIIVGAARFIRFPIDSKTFYSKSTVRSVILMACTRPMRSTRYASSFMSRFLTKKIALKRRLTLSSVRYISRPRNVPRQFDAYITKLLRVTGQSSRTRFPAMIVLVACSATRCFFPVLP